MQDLNVLRNNFLNYDVRGMIEYLNLLDNNGFINEDMLTFDKYNVYRLSDPSIVNYEDIFENKNNGIKCYYSATLYSDGKLDYDYSTEKTVYIILPEELNKNVKKNLKDLVKCERVISGYNKEFYDDIEIFVPDMYKDFIKIKDKVDGYIISIDKTLKNTYGMDGILYRFHRDIDISEYVMPLSELFNDKKLMILDGVVAYNLEDYKENRKYNTYNLEPSIEVFNNLTKIVDACYNYSKYKENN